MRSLEASRGCVIKQYMLQFGDPLRRLDSSTKLLTIDADVMHAITQVTAVASSEPSTEPDLLADIALNLLLALTNADNLGLVDWEGRALAYILGTAMPATAPAPAFASHR